MFSFVLVAAILKVVSIFVRLCYLSYCLVLVLSSELIHLSHTFLLVIIPSYCQFCLALPLFSYVLILRDLTFFEELAFFKNCQIPHSPTLVDI